MPKTKCPKCSSLIEYHEAQIGDDIFCTNCKARFKTKRQETSNPQPHQPITHDDADETVARLSGINMFFSVFGYSVLALVLFGAFMGIANGPYRSDDSSTMFFLSLAVMLTTIIVVLLIINSRLGEINSKLK